MDTSGFRVGATARRPPPPAQVCWLGPEPQGTPNHTFLPPNGSPSHHLGHRDRDPTQNSGPDLAMGVPGPKSQLFFAYFGPKMPKSIFSGRVSNLSATHSNGFGAPWAQGAHGAPVHGPPKGPRGPRGPRGARPEVAQGAQGPKGPLETPRGPWGALGTQKNTKKIQKKSST